jgi:enamine deaminase RidA (YjgF/YER057c/UK114 family)
MMRYRMALAVFLPSYSPYQARGSAQDFMAERRASMRFKQHHSVTRKDRQSLGVCAQISLYLDEKRQAEGISRKGSAMKIERHETGPRMSKAVIHGDTVYLAGIVADSPKGKSVAEQSKNILSQIDGFLALAGTDKTKLLSTNIWITDMANFPEMNAVWDSWVSPGNTPARATVEAKLASPDYKVEIMVVAAR